LAAALRLLQPSGGTLSEPILTHRGVVYPWQCDHMGHMNVMWYVGKFDEATWQLIATFGLTAEAMRASGTGMVAVEQTVNYRRELLAGDLLSIYSQLLEVREKAIRFTHEMRNDATGEVAATTVLVGVHLDARLRKASPIPADVCERARQMLARP
jgi:acyl-CoA thioester hydrolase